MTPGPHPAPPSAHAVAAPANPPPTMIQRVSVGSCGMRSLMAQISRDNFTLIRRCRFDGRRALKKPDHRRQNIMRTITFLAMGGMMLAFAISGMAKAHFG